MWKSVRRLKKLNLVKIGNRVWGEIGVFESAVLFIFGVAIAIFFIGIEVGSSEMEKEAIHRGYALYCPDTGDFSWKNECDNQRKEIVQ